MLRGRTINAYEKTNTRYLTMNELEKEDRAKTNLKKTMSNTYYTKKYTQYKTKQK